MKKEKEHNREMDKIKSFALAIALVIVFAQSAAARFVTLSARSENGTNYFDVLTLATNEVAEVRSLFENGFRSNAGGAGAVDVVISRGGNTFYVNSLLFLNSTTALKTPLFVSGPATITLENSTRFPAFATVEVKTEAFPPDKTLIIPGDSNGANVIMESSTDLVNWSSASPGAYTNRTNNLFFRIRAERFP